MKDFLLKKDFQLIFFFFSFSFLFLFFLLFCAANIWRCITDTFDYLGLAAMINGRVFCVHGGLTPQILTLDEVYFPSSLNKPKQT